MKFLRLLLRVQRVFQQKEDREILLYYVRALETCTVPLAAAYFDNKSTSHGVVVEPAQVLIFPASLIMEWQLRYLSCNKYVMQRFRKRYDELVSSFQQAVFEHVDVRLMEYLKKKVWMTTSAIISVSHQNLARELGTTRVVISLILKEFEHEKEN